MLVGIEKGSDTTKTEALFSSVLNFIVDRSDDVGKFVNRRVL